MKVGVGVFDDVGVLVDVAVGVLVAVPVEVNVDVTGGVFVGLPQVFKGLNEFCGSLGLNKRKSVALFLESTQLPDMSS